MVFIPSRLTTRQSIVARLRSLAQSIGPGLFIIGYIIGTGSVTSMAKAGAEYGLSLVWALACSCFATYVLVVAVSHVTIVYGQTLIHCIRERFGYATAIAIIVGLMATVIPSVMGVMGIATDVVRQWTSQMTGGTGVPPLVSAALFNAMLLGLFWKGSHRLFLGVMAAIVAVMGVSFFVTMVLVTPSLPELLASIKPAIPSDGDALLVLAAMIGTTMASVCIVARSYLVAEQQWTLNDLAIENRDAVISLGLTSLVSAAIMACAAGTMKPAGLKVEQAIDMVRTLEPLSGRYATALFVTGIVAAALSSLFPNYVLGPWLVCDYLNIPRRMDRRPIRIAVAAVAALAFVVPIFGGQPVLVMIVSQAISPVVMPILIVLLMVLINGRRSNDYEPPLALNIGLWITLGFSLFASYAAILGLQSTLRRTFGA